MDKILLEEVILEGSASKVFEMFTKNEHLEKWLTTKADVQPHVGGKYELFWNPEDRINNSTIGCRVLAINDPYYINFEWKGPKQFKNFMNTRRPLTNVTIIFLPQNKRTRVTLIHTGWANTEDWEQAWNFFHQAWKVAFSQLQEYFSQHD